MLVSYRWLGRHVDLEGIGPEQLADDLTLSTCEVEALLPFAPQLGDLAVGYVQERADHPAADKLCVCTVDLGRGEPLQIVCGAPNVDAGQKVAVATIGTVLPGDFKIKKSKIRGVESRGMICSERELEIGDDHSGIWVLPEEAEVGRPVAEALGLADWVLEIENKSLTHRPDLWGHRGLAGEVAAIYRREQKPLDLGLPPLGDGRPFPLRVASPDCPRYLGLVIDGVEAARSPDWLRFLLLAAGQRPIDLVVDVSNFVMLDLGQPNHTFDRTQLSPEGILVRNARAGESLVTLDGELRRLEPSDLLICSGDEPVALAGIMGGQGSRVEAGTSQLLLEVANFHPGAVRRTSARLGLRSDASARFEKHLDPTLPERAAAHFARLLAKLQPQVSFPCALADQGQWTDPAHALRLRPQHVRTALGTEVDDDEIEDLLTRLGFGVSRDAQGMLVQVPSARSTSDVTIEQDLVEEVGRLQRYENVPEASLVAEVAPPPPDPRRRMLRRIQDRLAGAARFHEVISYAFHSDELLRSVGMWNLAHVEVVNPVVEGQSRVRRAVLPSLLADLVPNRRQRDEVRLFEIGKGYAPENANERGEPEELHQLALAWASPPLSEGAPFDAGRFERLHGVLVDLFSHLGLEPPTWGPCPGEPPPWAHPSKLLCAFHDGQEEPLGILAQLEPGVARRLGLEDELASDVALAQVSIDRLLQAPERPAGYRPIPRYPGVKVDVAVLAPESLAAAEVSGAIEAAGKGLVAGVELFDLYRGESLGAGRKSLAWHVLLSSGHKTLSDKDGQKFLDRLERGLEAIGAQLRRG